jgi:hypothetical protein
MQWRLCSLLVLGCGLPGAMAAATGIGETSLQAAGALGPACWHRLPGTTAAAAGMEGTSLWAEGVLGPACHVPASRSHKNRCSHGRTKQPWGLLTSVGYQEPYQLLQAWDIQACGQWQFWGLLARCQCPGATGAAVVTGQQSLWARELWGLAGCWEYGTAPAASMGNQAFWLAPSVTSGVAGALGPAYIGVLASLMFQGEGSRSYSWGELGAVSSCVCQEAGFTTQWALRNGPGAMYKRQG